MNEMNFKRWLIASLVLNLFLAGGIAGGAWRWWHSQQGEPGAPAAQVRGLRFAADDLTTEQRQKFRIGLRDARREVASSVKAARESRLEVLKLIAAAEFDRTAVTAALARTRDADTAARARLETSVVEFASTLSADDRKVLAAGLVKRSMLAPASPPTPKQ